MNNNFLEIWNHSHKKHFHGDIKYDGWLDKTIFKTIIDSHNDLFLDLGCGQGNNTLYLLEKGKKVISADISDEALKIVKSNIPGSNTIQLDMSKPLPFNDNMFGIVVSDFSLQYFSEETTKCIIQELRRITKNKGYLILRLSSINDSNYGAMKGEKIEEHYYYVEKRNKRYYDVPDIKKFFSNWKICYIHEFKSKLERYEHERDYFEVLILNEK